MDVDRTDGRIHAARKGERVVSRLALGTFAGGAGPVSARAGTALPPSIVTSGPTFSTTTLGTAVATGSATVHLPFTVTLFDFVAGHNPAWFGGLKTYKRAHNDSTSIVGIVELKPQPESVTWTNAVDLGSGSTTWDIGFSHVGANGRESVIVWPAAFSNIDVGKLLEIANNAVTWATFKGDTSGDTTTAVADTANKRLLHAGMSTQTQATVQPTPDANSSYLTHGTVFQEHISGMTGTGNVNLDGMPNGSTYARVKGSELASGTVKQLNDGTNVRTAANVAAIVNSSGQLPSSTAIIALTPNTVAYVTDATIEFSWTGSGPYTVKIWFDNGTAATDASVIYPDGSPTVNLGHTTSAAPSYTESGVAGGTNYYAVLSRAANGTVSMTVQKTPFTISAFAAFFADGGIVPAAAQGATPLFSASGTGGGGGTSGGGGGHPLK